MHLNSEQLAIHDMSKYLPEEFEAYAIWYCGTEEERQEKYVYSNYMLAWQSHVNTNPHHWQHWVLGNIMPESIDGIDENKTVIMPWSYVLEMVVDWQATEIQYKKHHDMSIWLNKNFDKMILHKMTRGNVIIALQKIGYTKFGDDFILTGREDISEITAQYLMR